MKKISYQKSRKCKYPFIDMCVDEEHVFKNLKSREEAIKIRCAAHTIGFNKQWVFRTKIRETDAGNFELTVKMCA